jgi:hypothetical protein
MKTHEPPFTAGEIIKDMQSQGMIPSAPAPGPRHRIAETLAYALSGACLGVAAAIGALLILQTLKLL